MRVWRDRSDLIDVVPRVLGEVRDSWQTRIGHPWGGLFTKHYGNRSIFTHTGMGTSIWWPVGVRTPVAGWM